jgi:hypothetical protein
MTLVDVVSAFIAAYIAGFLGGATFGWFMSVIFSVIK